MERIKWRIRKEQIPVCRKARDALTRHLDYLAGITDYYPVICSFGDFRFIFECHQDILDVIGWLNTELLAAS